METDEAQGRLNTGAGKGDAPRPTDGTKYREGWERIFGAKPRKEGDAKMCPECYGFGEDEDGVCEGCCGFGEVPADEES